MLVSQRFYIWEHLQLRSAASFRLFSMMRGCGQNHRKWALDVRQPQQPHRKNMVIMTMVRTSIICKTNMEKDLYGEMKIGRELDVFHNFSKFMFLRITYILKISAIRRETAPTSTGRNRMCRKNRKLCRKIFSRRREEKISNSDAVNSYLERCWGGLQQLNQRVFGSDREHRNVGRSALDQ